MTKTLTGTCRLCGESFGRGISSHVKSCITDHANQASLHHGLLMGVRATGLAGRFWMYLLVQPESSLRELDDFFRDTWLEHDSTPSLFDIEQDQYLSTIDPDHEDQAPMHSLDRPIGSLLRPRMEFDYLFDPDDPTELECRVFDPYPCPAQLLSAEDDEGDNQHRDETIVVVARNEPPEIECSTCEQQAEFVCLACVQRQQKAQSASTENEQDEQDEHDTQNEQDPEQQEADQQPQETGPGRWVCPQCQSIHQGPFARIINSPRLKPQDA